MSESTRAPRLALLGGAILLASAAATWFVFHDDLSSPGTAVLGGYRERWFLLAAGLTYSSMLLLGMGLLRPGRRGLARLFLLHLGLAVPVLAAEAVAAAGLFDFRTLKKEVGHRATRTAEDVHPKLRRVGVPDASSSGEILPDLVKNFGVEAEPIQFAYQTDSLGLRNPGPKQDAKVLCLGDSVLVAGLVPVEEILTEQLEERLGKQVLNVSEVGYCPQEELIRLGTVTDDLAGKVVVQFVFEGNDLSDSGRWRKWSARTGKTGGADWPRSGLIKTVLQSLHRPKVRAGARRVGHFAAADGEEVDVYFLYDGAVIRAALPELEVLRETFRGAREEIEAAGGRYAIALIPSKITTLHGLCTFPEDSAIADPAHADSGLAAALATLCEEESIPFRDTTPALRAVAAGGELPFFPADTHLNATGHRTMAEALAEWIDALSPE